MPCMLHWQARTSAIIPPYWTLLQLNYGSYGGVVTLSTSGDCLMYVGSVQLYINQCSLLWTLLRVCGWCGVLFISCVVPVPNVTLWCYTNTKNIADSPSLRVSGPSRPRLVAPPPPYYLGVGLSFKSAQNKKYP